MRKRRWFLTGSAMVVLIVGIVAWCLDVIPRPTIEDGDYPMERVSALKECSHSDVRELAMGQPGWWKVAPDKDVVWVASNTNWKTVPDKAVKAYPALKSRRALYGAIDFGKDRNTPGKGNPYRFVVDESAGTGRGYDRLNFDANRDLDLTNDPVLSAWETSPTSLPKRWESGKNTFFHPLSVPFDFGSEFQGKSAEILPRLTVFDSIEKGEILIDFIMLEARKGKIQIGRRRYQAILAQPWLITGPYDKPSTSLYLTTTWPWAIRQEWYGADQLSVFRLVDGQFYSTSTTPTGDTLLVRRYRGPLGVFRVSPGNRQVREVGMSGLLRCADWSVPVGTVAYHSYFPEKVEECQLPAGDYAPTELWVRFGRLRLFLSDNYHTDGKHQGARVGKPVYGIKIRPERPFLLDFSNRPEVLFASPAKDQVVKPGDEVEVKAVLIDPPLNTMIRELYDTSRKTSRKAGTTLTEEEVRLDPTVVITDSSGKKVAEGLMPFG